MTLGVKQSFNEELRVFDAPGNLLKEALLHLLVPILVVKHEP